MTQHKIRVGIIGASTNPFAWSSIAHVPALKALPEYELVAVASRNQDNADQAARLHGIPQAYGNYREMVERPDIDMICVSTSAEFHRSLVMPAIETGKHVFCEWPFGTHLTDALAMRDAAEAAGVRTLVGLQTRYAPIVSHVRDLIAGGFVGDVWSVKLERASDQAAQIALTPEFLYMLEKSEAGLKIMAGHALDTLAACSGEFVDLKAYLGNQMDRVKLTTGAWAPLTIKDHILVQGRLDGGALASAMIKMNSPAYRSFQLEISGSSGALVINGLDRDLHTRQPGLPFEYELSGTSALGHPFEPMPIPQGDTIAESLAGSAAANVARMFQDFAKAVKTGERCETDFDHGILRHRLLRGIEDAAAT